MTKLVTAACVAVSILAAPLAIAQEQEHRHDGSALGEVNFPVSCNDQAQSRFNTTAALLYSFYWEKVDSAVAAVLRADPTCAMAYWAKAVASLDNPLGSPPTPKQEQEGWAAVEKAKQLGGRTPRERDYIGAVETVFKDHATVPFKTRATTYEKALEQIHARYPKDVEAAVLYAYWLQVTADRSDQTYAQQLKSARILEKVSASHPRHPGVVHFLIHAYDFPSIAEQGLDAARRYAAIAPDSPHALHMPSHIFSRVGQWQDSIEMNLRSHASAKMHRDVYHALDYLTYASLQLGRDAQAGEWVKFVESNQTLNEQTRQIAYAAAVIPARYALERGAWADASQLTVREGNTPFAEAMTHFARALGAARSGKPTDATATIARLAVLRDTLREMKDPYWTEQVDIQRRVALAWQTYAQGNNNEGLAQMSAAADAEDATDKAAISPGPRSKRR